MKQGVAGSVTLNSWVIREDCHCLAFFVMASIDSIAFTALMIHCYKRQCLKHMQLTIIWNQDHYVFHHFVLILFLSLLPRCCSWLWVWKACSARQLKKLKNIRKDYCRAQTKHKQRLELTLHAKKFLPKKKRSFGNRGNNNQL